MQSFATEEMRQSLRLGFSPSAYFNSSLYEDSSSFESDPEEDGAEYTPKPPVPVLKVREDSSASDTQLSNEMVSSGHLREDPSSASSSNDYTTSFRTHRRECAKRLLAMASKSDDHASFTQTPRPRSKRITLGPKTSSRSFLVDSSSSSDDGYTPAATFRGKTRSTSPKRVER